MLRRTFCFWTGEIYPAAVLLHDVALVLQQGGQHCDSESAPPGHRLISYPNCTKKPCQ